jgi:hypothetical protein
MRIWQDAHDSLITDEQLVRHFAAYSRMCKPHSGFLKLASYDRPPVKAHKEVQPSFIAGLDSESHSCTARATKRHKLKVEDRS